MDLTHIANNGFDFNIQKSDEKMSLHTINSCITECITKLQGIKSKVDDIKDQWNSLNEDYSILSFADTLDPCIKENFQKAIDDLKVEYEDTKSTLKYFKELKNKTLLESDMTDIEITSDKLTEISDVLKDADRALEESQPSDALDILFKKFVPKNGKCETIGGEIIRAMMKLLYHGYKDNVYFYDDEGAEKMCHYVQYLINKGFDECIYNISDHRYSDDRYLEELESLCERVVKYLIDEPALFAESNTEDSAATPCEEFGESITSDRFTYELCPELIEMISNGKTDEIEIESSVFATFEDKISNRDLVHCDCGIVEVDGIDKNAVGALTNLFGKWEQGYIKSFDEE